MNPKSPDFYEQVMSVYDRTFYQNSMDDVELRLELQKLHKKWVEIQVFQK